MQIEAFLLSGESEGGHVAFFAKDRLVFGRFPPVDEGSGEGVGFG